MAFCISTTQLPFQKARPLAIIIIIFFLLPSAHSIYFNFPIFEPNNPTEVNYSSGVNTFGGVISLTNGNGGYSQAVPIGRAIYKNQIQIWDSQTRNLTDFNTQFSFIIDGQSQPSPRDGFTFFLSPDVSTNTIPNFVSGRNLGIYSDSNASDPKNQLVAIEFDTFRNDWDPSLPHVGININSRVSKITCDLWINSTNKVSKGNASVSYSASTKNLSVFLSYDQNPGFGVVPDLRYTVDLREILPEWVYVGFSATSEPIEVELLQIRSWEFNSNLETSPNLETSQTGNGGVNSTGVNDNGVPKKDDRKKTGLIAGMVVGGAVLCAGLGGLVLFGLKMKWNRSRKDERNRSQKEKGVAFEVEMNDEFERGTGPKRFSYSELVLATRDFSEDGKLGEGGFGGVYRGFLDEMNLDVAVKRVSRDSKQGKKEYVSEVKIISRLRHRNLVQLLGWCHERDELLLIYELMPNGSLDFHLFHEKRLLRWTVRYKIATGLASALLYLHEEWEQCVVHRDIKSSNVMLDSNFNAKLGDFGLARLVDHEHGLQTTVIAGTRGYLAPECVTTGTTGKASKESDVYSFGVVALEIACGRRPVEPKAEAGKVMMVEWVWELYGKGMHLDAADEKLGKEFDVEQMETLMILGLWCAHPDHNSRPSIRQVIDVLNLGVPLPSLPSKMPVPMYFAPPIYNIPPKTVHSNPPSITSVGSGR